MQKFQPFVWLRCIDNIFYIWTHEEVELEKLMEECFLEYFCQTVNIHMDELLEKRVSSLDLNVSFENGSVIQIYTLRVQIAIKNSSYPCHLKHSIIYCQTLRLSNICTYEEDLDKHALNMKSCFLTCSYLKQMLIDSQIGKVKFDRR